MYLYRVGQGPFPKSDLDRMSVFPMIGLGSFVKAKQQSLSSLSR